MRASLNSEKMLEPGDFDQSVPVLIIKLRRYEIHHGAVGIARSLGRLGVPVYAIIQDHFTPLALSRYLAGAFRWSRSVLTAESVLEDLKSIARRLGRPAILIPTDDVASMFLAEHQAELAGSYILPHPPGGLPRLLCNKRELHRLCRNAGIPRPETAFPLSLDDVHAFIGNAVFPVVVKAAESQLLPRGAASTAIASTAEQLIELYQFAENPASPNLLLQEYIPRGSEDWVFHGYRNPQTECMVSFTGRKLRSWPPFAGPTTAGICEMNPRLLAQTEALLLAIDYAGIMDLDYRLDKRDGRYKLLDFNPRIGANFRMFTDHAGLDVVRALHLDLTGRPVQRKAMSEDVTFLAESYDFFASLGYIRQDALTVGEWWKSLQGKRELAWFHADDPIPFFVMWARLVSRTIGKTIRRRLTSGRPEDAPISPDGLETQRGPKVTSVSPDSPGATQR